MQQVEHKTLSSSPSMEKVNKRDLSDKNEMSRKHKYFFVLYVQEVSRPLQSF